MAKRIPKYLAIIFIILTVIVAIRIVPDWSAKDKVPEQITAAADRIAMSINNKDEKSFLSVMDEDNQTFFAEQKHLFKDIETLDIKDFKLIVRDYAPMSDLLYKVTMKQSYRLEGKRQSFSYDAVFKKVKNQYKFSDLYFGSLQTTHFIIKYSPSLTGKAKLLSTFIEDAYRSLESVYGLAPQDKTIVKLYDNNKVFSFFIKPSIKFEMGGWYEYAESIKINMSHIAGLADSEFIDTYKPIIAHELTHRINGIETNNNIPYWMAEGVATYVENNGKPDTVSLYLSIEALEKINLEELSKDEEIDDYYTSAYVNISLFIKKYGIAKLHEIMAGLGQYIVEERTAEEVLYKSNERFHEVLRKKLSLSVEQLDAELKK